MHSIREIRKFTLSSPCLWASFHPLSPPSSDLCKVSKRLERNHSSCTGRSSENIRSSSGGDQEKKERQGETQKMLFWVSRVFRPPPRKMLMYFLADFFFECHPFYDQTQGYWLSLFFSALSVRDVTVMLPVLHFCGRTGLCILTAGKCSLECIYESILMREKNGRNSWGEFSLITGHREKWRSEHRSTIVGWRAFDEKKNIHSSKKHMGVLKWKRNKIIIKIKNT